MKLILILFLIVGALTSAATALTLEEYIALPVDEKKQVLREGPEKVLDDPSMLLELHTIGLRDESSMIVRLMAAESSRMLMQELQWDKARNVSLLPEFSDEDSAAFQEALVAALWDDHKQVRESAAHALPLLAPPNPQIEAIIIEAYEENRILVAEPYESMAQVGYNSDRFVALALKLVQSKYTYFTAAEVLAKFTPEVALDTLIELAGSKEAPASMRYAAVEALAAYGRRAMRAKPVLERIIEDHPKHLETRKYTYKVPASELQPGQSAIRFLVDYETMKSDSIGITAARTLEAITLDKPKVASHYMNPIKLVQLWPLALPEAETSDTQQLNASSTELDEPNKLPSQIPSQQERPKEVTIAGDSADSPEELREHTWIWLGALVLVIIAVWIVLKRRR